MPLCRICGARTTIPEGSLCRRCQEQRDIRVYDRVVVWLMLGITLAVVVFRLGVVRWVLAALFWGAILWWGLSLTRGGVFPYDPAPRQEQVHP